MNSSLLRAAARLIVPIQVILSFLLLLRGHNEPGGGFIGGLVFASGFIIWFLAFGLEEMLRVLRVGPQGLVGGGVLILAVSGLAGELARRPFLTGLWLDWEIPTGVVGILKLGTPLLFDVGVFLVVGGAVLTMVVAMERTSGGQGQV